MLLTERIKSLAEPLGMTFASIERDIGIGRGTIRKWDTNCPAADKLLKVANLLNTSIDFLLTGNNYNDMLPANDREWILLIHQLPLEAQYEFRGEMKGYLKRLNEESVAADKSLKQVKDNESEDIVMSNTDKQEFTWAEHLESVGSTTYYQEHSKILKEMCPDGKYGSAEWNEASVEAIIKAVVTMIERNNIALLTEIDCLEDEP